MPVDRGWGELLVQCDPELAPVLAVASNIDSLHRMSREERDFRGIAITGSDHLTVYNLYAEAVNRCGSVAKVFGLDRHVFEEGIAAWAEERGVLVKAIEDAAMGMASVYRSLELGLPRGLPYVTKELKAKFLDLLARVMPFDLVMDDRTADGQDVRIGKSSLAGNWGATAGTVRYFADRFGTPRASIDGTTIPLDLVRQNAKRGAPMVRMTGGRKQPQRLVVARTLSYFGFELETVEEPLIEPVSEGLRGALVDALADGLIDGSAAHPDQGLVRRAVRELGDLWRRSGGREKGCDPDAVRTAVAAQLGGVESWRAFQERRVVLRVEDYVDPGVRGRLATLPSTIRLFGYATAVEYDIVRGRAVARIRLREGQARRLTANDQPAFDRPVLYSVTRGDEAPIEAESLDALGALLRKPSPRSHPHGQRKERRRIPKPPKRRR